MKRSPHKASNILTGVMVALLLLLFARPTKAEVYKCENAAGSIVYSDTPCRSSHTQSITDIKPALIVNQGKAKPLVMRQLDDAVKSAIAAEDFVRADALAVTSEQRQWIAAAKKESAGKAAAGLSGADLIIAEKSDSEECRLAKDSLEKEANSSSQKADALRAKTSLMRAACGLYDGADPDYTTTYNQNVPFLFDTHRRHSYRNLHGYPHARYPYNIKPPYRSHHGSKPYTSAPYDRHMQKPFGNNYIRPEETSR